MSEASVVININCPGGSTAPGETEMDDAPVSQVQHVQAIVHAQQRMIEGLRTRISKVEAKFGGTFEDG